jgi:hypothetical protein
MDFSMNCPVTASVLFFCFVVLYQTEKVADNVRIMVRGFLYVIPLVVP